MDKNIILVPVDFTEVTNIAVNHAITLAKKTNSEIKLLHVIEKPFFSVGRKSKDTDLIEAGTVKKLQEIADDIENKHKLEVDILALPGSIYDTITAVASEVAANFVVMGTHGMKGMQYLKGSNALKVIYHATLPFVLTQKKNPAENGYDNIVFPLDSNQESAQKTDWAIYFSQRFGAKINILTPTETDAYLVKRVKKNLNYAKTRFERNNVDFSITNSSRDNAYLAEETNKFAEQINANLIMIMIYPERGAGEFFLTPTQQRIITNPAQIPVICINPGALFSLQDIK